MTRLAEAVLALAVQDAIRGDQEAREFIRAENEAFTLWADLLGLDPHWLAARRTVATMSRAQLDALSDPRTVI
jgi:hypothetical protein